ncbi:MAG: glycine zipper 2TM domain-containing protein [Aquificaceae bacterium]|nr:glycine zipper 2TM domain-containing protein [Aquificaceae bacterium]MDW8237686.1 glycine zipper 2TM domain-containing protein [Aquificaceae bacterium]
MKRFLAIFAVAGVFISALSCAAGTSGSAAQGAGVGAVGGAAAGALIDKENRWRGAVIGGALGAVIGGTMTEIASRSAREAASQNRPVEYISEDKKQRVVSEPVANRGNCRIVRTTYYQDGKPVKTEEKEVCN